jgi:hypothetical protein
MNRIGLEGKEDASACALAGGAVITSASSTTSGLKQRRKAYIPEIMDSSSDIDGKGNRNRAQATNLDRFFKQI